MKYFTLFFNIKYCNAKPPSVMYDWRSNDYGGNPWMHIENAPHRHLFWKVWYKA